MIDDSHFSPLKDMESFTEAMFNRIIDFQEKKHKAWNASAPFSERIAELPLHYFIFSNYDRDPAKQGPTLAHYYPLKWEMHKLAHYLHAAGCRHVIDYYPGNGLLGSLLAQASKLPTLGLAYQNQKPSQIENFFDRENYQMLASAAQFSPPNDHGYFVSWTPSGQNPSPTLLSTKPRAIIFVGSEHLNSQTGERQVGVDNMFDGLRETYTEIDSWQITRPENLLHQVWPDMTANIEESRQVYVFVENRLARDMAPLETPAMASDNDEAYFWEHELRMAELALEAMRRVSQLTLSH